MPEIYVYHSIDAAGVATPTARYSAAQATPYLSGTPTSFLNFYNWPARSVQPPHVTVGLSTILPWTAPVANITLAEANLELLYQHTINGTPQLYRPQFGLAGALSKLFVFGIEEWEIERIRPT